MLINQITTFTYLFVDFSVTVAAFFRVISVCCYELPSWTNCHGYKQVARTSHLSSSACLVFFWCVLLFRSTCLFCLSIYLCCSRAEHLIRRVCTFDKLPKMQQPRSRAKNLDKIKPWVYAFQVKVSWLAVSQRTYSYNLNYVGLSHLMSEHADPNSSIYCTYHALSPLSLVITSDKDIVFAFLSLCVRYPRSYELLLIFDGSF